MRKDIKMLLCVFVAFVTFTTQVACVPYFQFNHARKKQDYAWCNGAHNWDIGTFKFSKTAQTNLNDASGTWTYKCTNKNCMAMRNEKGIMCRTGNSLYAYEQLTNGKFCNGTEFDVGSKIFKNSDGKNLLVLLGQKFYRDLFVECEKVLHDTEKDYLSFDGVFVYLGKNDISVVMNTTGLDSNQVRLFLEGVKY